MFRHPIAALLLGSAVLFPFQQKPLSSPPADKIRTARAMYYTPTAQGLRGFHCAVTMDWAKLFGGFGTTLPADSPVLRYFDSTRLSVSDSLKGKGALEWADTSTPPETLTKAAAQMKTGMQQIMDGFFQAWNGYVNGTMVSAPDEAATVTEIPGGFSLHTKSAAYDVTEEFDSNILLKTAHVISADADIVATPSYEQTPGGLRIASIANVVRQPKTAAPIQMKMSVTYAPVSGYDIPNGLRVDILNSGDFTFAFDHCVVDAQAEK